MKKALMYLFLVCAASALFSLEVDRKELEKEIGTTIEFINYNGPHTVVNTAEEIRGIGTMLSDGLSASGFSGNEATYQIIHAVDPSEEGKLDADILVIGKNATVDHIDNIRRILSAYLSREYGYSQKDATTLAFYVTIYNAVYRGNMEMFAKRYKSVVTSHLSGENAGISVRWDEWPGKTRMVIPLNDPRLTGTISTIDTSILSDDDVTDKMREEDDAALDTRKDMVDLKERESEEAQDRAEQSQKDAASARSETEQKRKEAAVAEKEAATAKKDAEKAREKAEAEPDNKEAQKAAVEAETLAEKKESEAQEKKEDLAVAEETLAEKESDAAKDQTMADTKQREALDERKEIASDTQKVIDQQAAEERKAAEAAFKSVIPGYALRVIDKRSLVCELVLVNLADGSTLKTSSLNSIRNRAVIDAGGSLMAVAGKKEGSGDVTLVLIDPETLEMTKSGDVSLSEYSVLVKSGNDYYAVVEQKSGDCVIGRFDANLELKTSSTVSVLPETAITVTPQGLLVQDRSGNIQLLRAADLTSQSE